MTTRLPFYAFFLPGWKVPTTRTFFLHLLPLTDELMAFVQRRRNTNEDDVNEAERWSFWKKRCKKKKKTGLRSEIRSFTPSLPLLPIHLPFLVPYSLAPLFPVWHLPKSTKLPLLVRSSLQNQNIVFVYNFTWFWNHGFPFALDSGYLFHCVHS